jgi:hypothetical protein
MSFRRARYYGRTYILKVFDASLRHGRRFFLGQGSLGSVYLNLQLILRDVVGIMELRMIPAALRESEQKDCDRWACASDVLTYWMPS